MLHSKVCGDCASLKTYFEQAKEGSQLLYSEKEEEGHISKTNKTTKFI
jgi:hypothetical protein